MTHGSCTVYILVLLCPFNLFYSGFAGKTQNWREILRNQSPTQSSYSQKKWGMLRYFALNQFLQSSNLPFINFKLWSLCTSRICLVSLFWDLTKLWSNMKTFFQARHIMAERNVLLKNVKHPFLVVSIFHTNLSIWAVHLHLHSNRMLPCG